MTPLTTAPPPPPAAHGVSDDLTAHEEMQLELLEELPVRLEPEALAAILGLHEQGKTPKTIGGAMSLHRVVVTLELRRELQRRAGQRQAGSETGLDDEEKLPRLTRREWNRLAKGSHVPNQPIRNMLETAIRFRPGLTERSVLSDAEVPDVTHAKRLLGIKPYPGSKRPSQTISCDLAASLARALGRGPMEVPGL